MPKVIYITPKEPEIDWLKGLILERLDAKGMRLKELAEEIPYSYEYLRRQMSKHPCEWTPEFRRSVLNALNIQIKKLPMTIGALIAAYPGQ